MSKGERVGRPELNGGDAQDALPRHAELRVAAEAAKEAYGKPDDLRAFERLAAIATPDVILALLDGLEAQREATSILNDQRKANGAADVINWIDWSGLPSGKGPEHDRLVMVRFRNGVVPTRATKASFWDWAARQHPYDIVAYAPVEPDDGASCASTSDRNNASRERQQ